MSKPANKTLIGVFLLGATALLVIAVIVLGSGRFFRNTVKAVCFFEGSIGGLNVGAPVVFNGVGIGSVREVILRFDMGDLTTTIPVFIEIDPQRVDTVGLPAEGFEKSLRLLIDHGLKARLELQSIVTGALQVALGSYPERPAKFVGADQRYVEIPTIPTPLQEITKKLEQLPIEEIITDIATAVDGINRVLNSPEMTKTIQSVSLAAEEAKGLMLNLNSRVEPVSADLQQTMQETRNLLREFDVKAATLTSGFDGALKDIQELAQHVDRQVGPLSLSMQRTLSGIEKISDEAGMTLREVQQTFAALEGNIGEDSELMYELKKAVKEMGTAGKAIRSLAKALEQQPESLLFGRKKKTGR
ncbi:MAG: MlaD family protein [Desulfatiglandales bacterium]